MESHGFNVKEYLGRPVADLIAKKQFFSKTGMDKKTRQNIQIDCEFSEIVTKTGNPKGVFHNCKEKGLSAFTPEGSDLIEFITLYNQAIDKFSMFPYELPYGLKYDLKNQDIVRRFGDSKEKGGGSIPIWINYEHMGIQFTFLNKDWSDPQNPITHITIFANKKLQEDCSLCLKEFKKVENEKYIARCEACELLFCSESCFAEFRKIHVCPKQIQ